MMHPPAPLVRFLTARSLAGLVAVLLCVAALGDARPIRATSGVSPLCPP